MIESISDNPPAFPGGVVPGPDYHAPLNPGMTLRDWFAGQALSSYSDWTMLPKESYGGEAAALYAMADAMLKERGKPREETK